MIDPIAIFDDPWMQTASALLGGALASRSRVLHRLNSLPRFSSRRVKGRAKRHARWKKQKAQRLARKITRQARR